LTIKKRFDYFSVCTPPFSKINVLSSNIEKDFLGQFKI
jgi:hypothetical protein